MSVEGVKCYTPSFWSGKADFYRDLAWLIGSSSLINHSGDSSLINTQECHRFYANAHKALLSLYDSQYAFPSHLLDSLKTQRVGLYFEALARVWFEALMNKGVIGHNVQVHHGGRTLGAFDFLLRNPDGSVEHWELTVKFYLALEPLTDTAHWVGLNRKDTLARKVSHMFNHQLPLSASEAGKKTLAALGVTQKPIQRALIKGWLFRPYGVGDGLIAQGAKGANYGRWFYHSQLDAFADSYQESYWFVRHKPDWLSPLSLPCDACLHASTWIASLKSQPPQRPVMLSRLELDHSLCHEVERIILVPDGWYGS